MIDGSNLFCFAACFLLLIVACIYVHVCRKIPLVAACSHTLLTYFCYALILMYIRNAPQLFSIHEQDWVKEAGYTTDQIRESTKEINRIKKQREISRKKRWVIVLHNLCEWLHRPHAKAKPSCLHRRSIRMAKEGEGHEVTPDPLDSPSTASLHSRICGSRFSRPLRAPSA